MKLTEIYQQFTVGSNGFCIAVETHCGFGISRAEIMRIAELADDADAFQRIWKGDDSWTDANNV